MAPQRVGGRAGQPRQRFELGCEAATAAACGTALEQQAAVTAARAATAQLGAQVVLVAAYCRRLQRLASLLHQYDCHLKHTLAALGLVPSCARPTAAAAAPAPKELASSLQQLERQLTGVAICGHGEIPTAEDLLQLAYEQDLAVGACLAAAGAPAILASLLDSVLQDLTAVNAWPALEPPGSSAEPALGSSVVAGSPLGPGFAGLQQAQRARWEAQAQRGQELERLRGEVVAARQALSDAAGTSADTAAGEGSSSGGAKEGEAAALRAQLAAQQAGLRAELHSLERARLAAAEQSAAAAARAAQVQSAAAAVAGAEQREARLDAAVRALCAADSAAMRRWRQGTWQAQEAVEAGIAAQRPPLMQLGQQLREAQRCELAAFRQAGPAGAQAAAGEEERAACGQPAFQAGAEGKLGVQGDGASASSAAMRGAAQLLDPAARFKSDEYAEAVVAAAAAVLHQLQPVQQQWAALAATSASQLAALQAAAEELEGRVQLLHEDSAAGGLDKLREAAAAAEEAGVLVGRTRQALSEWWTSPAITATPWIKREGKSAEEWLRLLGDQQRMLRQREVFSGKDHSNSLLRQLR